MSRRAGSRRPRRWPAGPTGLAAVLLCSAALLPPAVAKSERELVKEADAFVKNKPAPLQQFLHTLYMEGEWSSVLNLNLFALAALEVGKPDLAERALDLSTARILRIYADDPNAAKARSLWSAEEEKDFKGEPFERAMAFLYRGLLYLREGDFQNARASFLQSDLQNAMGQTEKYASSFALPVFLAAWASSCDGDEARAADLLAQARKFAVDPYFKRFGDKLPRHITLLERGIGPEKVTLGDAKAILSFLPQPDTASMVSTVYATAPAGATPDQDVAANLDWLALTRGGRPIQGILNGKVSFKETTGNIADFGNQMASSLYQSLGQLGADKAAVAKNLASLGLGAQVLGGFAGLLSSRTNTEADTRYWGSLPKIFVIESFKDSADVSVKHFLVAGAAKPRPVLVSLPAGGKCSFAWGREVPGLDATHGGAGNPSPWPAEPRESKRDKANEGLRNLLRTSMQ